MIGFLTSLFSSGVVGTVERIASEAIETDKESAEAKTLFIKTLDPNGIMRRELSRFACKAYGTYLAVMMVLNIMHFFGLGDPDAAQQAAEAMTELFLPVTGAWVTIVSASFGVNASNNWKDVKLKEK